jgi:hypothetical protein
MHLMLPREMLEAFRSTAEPVYTPTRCTVEKTRVDDLPPELPSMHLALTRELMVAFRSTAEPVYTPTRRTSKIDADRRFRWWALFLQRYKQLL